MTPATAMAALGLQSMPATLAELQKQVAATMNPRRWSWVQTEAYQRLQAHLQKGSESCISIFSTRAVDPDSKQKPRNIKGSQHPTAEGLKMGAYRPGVTRRANPALSRPAS